MCRRYHYKATYKDTPCDDCLRRARIEARAEDEGEYCGSQDPLFNLIQVLIASDLIVDEDSVFVNCSDMSDV